MGDDENSVTEAESFRSFASSRDRRLRNQLVERHMGLAVHLARRFSHGGGIDEDLRQVAMLGLVKAVDRFDPEMGVPFASFAGLTIEGELRRHFRDRTWLVKVPRSAKELHLLVRGAVEEMTHRDSRAPTVDHLARHLEIPRDDVLRGLAASAAVSVGSLEASAFDDSAAGGRRNEVSVVERGFAEADGIDEVEGLLNLLPEREREIVRLRVYEQLSQSEIAAIVGVSQMHVSRLLRRSFEQLREAVDQSS